MFYVDNQSRRAVYEQIVSQVEKYVLSGILQGGDKMPSVRKLSIELNVNPNTVQRAYTELERSDVIVTAPGRGAFVSDAGSQTLKENRKAQFLSELEHLASELKSMGIDKTLLVNVIEKVFKGGNRDD